MTADQLSILLSREFNFERQEIKCKCYLCQSTYGIKENELRVRSNLKLNDKYYICPTCAKDSWGMPRIVPHTCEHCFSVVGLDMLHYSSKNYQCNCSKDNSKMINEFPIEGTSYKLSITKCGCGGTSQRAIITVFDTDKNTIVKKYSSDYSKCPKNGNTPSHFDLENCRCYDYDEAIEIANLICAQIFIDDST